MIRFILIIVATYSITGLKYVDLQKSMDIVIAGIHISYGIGKKNNLNNLNTEFAV